MPKKALTTEYVKALTTERVTGWALSSLTGGLLLFPQRFTKTSHLESRSEFCIRPCLSSVLALQTKSIGYWCDEEKAAREYDRAALEMRGPSAELNFPGEAAQAGPNKPRKVATKEFVQLPMVSGEAVSLAVSSIVEAWKAGKPHPRMQHARREHTWQILHCTTTRFPDRQSAHSTSSKAS